MATSTPEAPPSLVVDPANAVVTCHDDPSTNPDRDPAHNEPESEPPTGTDLVGSAQQQQAGGDDTTERPRARSTAKNPRSAPSAPSADAFFGRREPLSVRAVADHLSRTPPSSPQPDEADSQGTVMDEITALYELSRRLPLTWDLVAWDQYDRLRVWYRYRNPREGVDPFHHGGADEAAWGAFGLRPRNWHAMHAHEYYPWLKYMTLDHLREVEAEAREADGALRAYDSTGLTCSVEFWSGIDERDHLMEVRGSRDHSLGHAFFISLFWKYRMASHKASALDGAGLTQAWAAFHATMKTKPHVVYLKLEEFYTRTLDGTRVRIHEVSRHHGLGCAVPIGSCPMCTGRTPKLPALCRKKFSHMLPVELQFYLAQLDDLLEMQAAAAKKPRREE